MIRVMLVVLVLLVLIDSSEARRRQRHSDRAPADTAQEAEGYSPSDDRRSRRSMRNVPPLVALVPPTWRVQPPDPNWQGKRFVSPDGASWFAAYTAPAEPNGVTAHMKAVTFVDGETVTYLQGSRDWVAVSGLKEGRVFYRRAMLACGGAKWHQVAFEYPAAAKREMDAFVTMASASLSNTRDDGCSDPRAVAGTGPAIAPPAGSIAPADAKGQNGR